MLRVSRNTMLLCNSGVDCDCCPGGLLDLLNWFVSVNLSSGSSLFIAQGPQLSREITRNDLLLPHSVIQTADVCLTSDLNWSLS